MPLVNQVQRILVRLWAAGDWKGVFEKHGWNFTGTQLTALGAKQFEDALCTQALQADRTKLGFRDFSSQGSRMITGGQPANSLLYHALASSTVHPTSNGLPSGDPNAYPSLDDLDTIENFIYAQVAGRTDLADTFVAVFAYQYRPASRTAHRSHADMAYSRTGVARVGTSPANYERARRSFWVLPADGSDGIAVLPARYGAFLARIAKPGAAGSVQGGHRGARDDSFVFPVHKLFDGSECIAGKTIAIRFAEFHRNEKLKRTHSLSEAKGGLPVPAGFDINLFPYVCDSTNGGNLVSLISAGSSVLVSPTPTPALVATVAQKNSVSNKNQIVHFVVPKLKDVGDRETRFTQSTLEIPSIGKHRLAPEYVNIRHEVDPVGPVTQKPKSLDLLPPDTFGAQMEAGGYAAAHFADATCDGCVEAIVSGVPAGPEDRPAFSLVTAIDLFPLADQIEIDQDASIENKEPLSGGRFPANPSLPLPSNANVKAFRHRDKTVTAVVGGLGHGPVVPVLGERNVLTSFLPDAASDVFAPGWDTSISRDAQGTFLTSSGLGSPFPEDAKLCAALSSYWPAVAPDASRTFGNDQWPNQLPMLDEELGFHPGHERVLSGQVPTSAGWDGEFGPFFEKLGSKWHVNYASIERSDYVTNALAGKIRVSLTATVQSADLLARAEALRRCERLLASLPTARGDCLVVVRKVAGWAAQGRGVAELAGSGFQFEFAKFGGKPVAVPGDLTRKRRAVVEKYVCQIAANGIALKRGNQAYRFFPTA